MRSENGSSSRVLWWIVTVLCTVVLGLIGAWGSQVNYDIRELQQGQAENREQYRVIQAQLDQLLKAHGIQTPAGGWSNQGKR